MSKPFEKSHWDDETINQLIARAQSGCRESQQELFDQLRTFLAYVANDQMETRLNAKLGASDIVQQAMTKAVLGLNDYRGSTAAEFRGWLKQIVVNEARQIKRGFNTDKRQIDREKQIEADSRMSGPVMQLADSMLTPGTEAIAEEQAMAVNDALKNLREDHQEVIRLRNWEGLTFSEIAHRMEITESSAAKLWYRSLIKLQEEFSRMQANDESS